MRAGWKVQRRVDEVIRRAVAGVHRRQLHRGVIGLVGLDERPRQLVAIQPMQTRQIQR